MGNDKHKKDKKQAVMGNAPSSQKKTSLVGAGIAVIVVAVIAFVMFGGGPGGFKTVSAEAGVVKIPLKDVMGDGQAHHYTYHGTKPINFFILKSSDGVVRAAFDACDVCFREKKGYRQEGDNMVCNNCGQRFPSVRINEIKGGCNPAPLNRRIEGEYLVLEAADIEAGVNYF